MTYETVSYEVKDGVAIITLNRPQQRNAVNSTMSRELPLVWQQFNKDTSAVVAILCLLYTSPSPRDRTRSRMPSSA